MNIPENIIYLDIETQYLANEVGGWGNIPDMKVAIVVIYDSKEDKFYHYTESQLSELTEKSKNADLIVGFNIKNFDYKVLQPYYDLLKLQELPTYDILEQVRKNTGFLVSLQNCAENTLGVGKSADGLKAVEWFRAGELQKVIDYCKQDVIVTRDLFLFLLKNGYIEYFDKRKNNKRVVKLEVNI